MSSPRDIPLRTPATWTADDKVSQCFSCRREFTLFNRKHHCRVCGRIFCATCSDNKIKIPSFIRHFIAASVGSVEPSVEKRVCTVCYNSTKVANDTKELIYIISNLPLSMLELRKCAILSQKWQGAVTTIMALWNSIQYKLPHTKFTKLERALIRNRIPEIGGHSAWAIQCIKALDIIPPSSKGKPNNCNLLLCRDGCEYRLQVYDLLVLYTHNHHINSKIDEWANNAWGMIDIKDHVRLMPWWVHVFRKRPWIAKDIFIYHICIYPEAVYAFFFELCLQSQDDMYQGVLMSILNHCLKIVKEDIRANWLASREFLNFLNKVANTTLEARKQRIITDYIIQLDGGHVLCPWDPTIEIHNIAHETVVLNSASKPLKITLYTANGSMDILWKHEDVRKDRMTMDITYWLERTCDNKVEFTRYEVFPVTSHSGIVAMLPGTTTLYDIKHKYKTTLQNFILERNANLTVSDLRMRFVKSVAAACVLSYVIGVGDRHLENMLVTDDGKLIHVDFSYLLGDDPKHVMNEMRITPDMLDALGGKGSTTFTQFQELCSDVYRVIRKKSSFWYSLLVYVADATPRVGNFWNQRLRVQQHVLERLSAGENEGEACMQIVEIVRRNSKDSYSQMLSDTAHGFANSLKQYGIFNLEL